MDACASREVLEQLLAGSLPPVEAKTLREHLAGCARCQALLERVSDDPELRRWASAAASRPVPAADESGLAPVLQRLRQMPFPGTPEPARDLEALGKPSRSAAPGETASRLTALGPYCILEELGHGGMGTVYKAQHTLLKRVVALKVLAADRTNDAAAVARFRREMEAVGQLQHPNIIEARDAGEVDGTHFLVMEYVEGPNLSQVVKRHGPLPVADACEIIRQAAAGLQHAHEHGLVHRDIKPSNLLLTPQGQVKVLDLGLALLLGELRVGEELTRPGQVMGTVEYMAPEQALDTHAVDIRADIYSLGCTLYFLLTGQPPFGSRKYKNSFQTMLAHAQEPVPPLRAGRPEAPPALVAVLDRLLAKRPAERFQTPAEVVKALESFCVGSGLCQPQSPAVPQLVREPEAESDAVSSPPAPAADKATENPVSSAMTGTRSSDEWLLAQNEALANRQAQPTASALAPAPQLSSCPEQPTRATVQRFLRSPGKPRVALSMAVAILLLGCGFLLVPQIILRIKGKDGQETTFKIPEGSEVKVEPDGKVTVTLRPDAEKPREQPRATPAVLQSKQLDSASSQSLSLAALVSRPTPIKDIRSWTIETVGHRGAVRAVTYGPDGRWLASAGEDGTVRLWEPPTGRLARALLGHDHRIFCLAWSPDGKTLASGGEDRTVRLWDATSGRLLRTVPGHASVVHDVAWSPDSQILASGSWDATIRLWDAKTGHQLVKLEGHETGVNVIAWSPDGRTLASGSGDRSVRLWDPRSGQLLHTLRCHTDRLESLTWSPDSKTLASASHSDSTIVFWERDSGQIVRGFQGNLHSVNAIAWSHDGKTLASVGNDSMVLLWDAISGQQLRILKGHTNNVLGVAWSPDGRSLVSGGEDSTVRVWDPRTGQHLRTLQGHPFQGQNPYGRAVAWSPDGKILAYASGDELRLSDVRSGQQVENFRGDVGVIGALAFSPDGRVLASGDFAGMVRLREIKSGQFLRAFQAHTRGHIGYIRALAWSPNSKTLASASRDKTVRLWDTGSGQHIRTLQGIEATAVALAWSPDGKTLASCEEGEKIRLWEVQSGELLPLLPGHPGMTTALAWSPDSKTLASGGHDNTVRLWDIGSGQLLCTLQGHTSRVYALAWSSDGQTLVSAGGDQMICLWDTRAEHLVRAVPGPVAFRGVFSPDRRLLASLGEVRLWETETGRCCLTTVALRNEQYLTVSADGHYRGSPQVERHLVYVVQTDHGQETLTPDEFAKRYGWKNDPERVRLTDP
jgi:WD40 repeat protein/serine/threonine protein kinase